MQVLTCKNMGLINKGWYGMFFTYGIWCVADILSVSPSSEQTDKQKYMRQVSVARMFESAPMKG